MDNTQIVEVAESVTSGIENLDINETVSSFV